MHLTTYTSAADFSRPFARRWANGKRSISTGASAERRIAAGEIHLWCNPEPRTMAGSARPTKRAIAVNGVYTPPEWWSRGYATACVAALSDTLIAQAPPESDERPSVLLIAYEILAIRGLRFPRPVRREQRTT